VDGWMDGWMDGWKGGWMFFFSEWPQYPKVLITIIRCLEFLPISYSVYKTKIKTSLNLLVISALKQSML